MSDNQFHGELPSLSGWHHLSDALFHKNSLKGSLTALDPNSDWFMDSNANRIKLKTLTLHSNHITSTIPEHFVVPYKLENLTLAYNQIQGSIPRSMLTNISSDSQSLFGKETDSRVLYRTGKM